VFILAWNRDRFWRSSGWTLVSGVPLGMGTIGMILEGAYAQLYWISAIFLLHLYLILVFRASIVMSRAHAQPGTPLNGGGVVRRDNVGVPAGPPSVT
jgi:hypothetical protein